MDTPSNQGYASLDEKAEDTDKIMAVRLSTPLPCISSGCLNKAIVGGVMYLQESNGWLLYPFCESHSRAVARLYTLPGDESPPH